MNKDKLELRRLKIKYNKLIKSLEKIRDFNGRFVGDLAGDEASDALHYTTKHLLERIK